jgi:hypothetical protein
MTHQKLSLFPLNTVMFPGTPLTLHIFEERYREMIGRCLEQSTPFGVVLIREGSEVGDTAKPYLIGTTAQINASVRLEDGRLLIATIGQRRFRIQYTLQSVPHLVASVALLPEESGVGVDLNQAAQNLRQAHEQYWQAVAAATGVQPDVEALPQDMVAMTYHLAHRLQVDNARKQRWLEVDVATRIREITSMLQAETELLPKRGGESPPGPLRQPWSWN